VITMPSGVTSVGLSPRSEGRCVADYCTRPDSLSWQAVDRGKRVWTVLVVVAEPSYDFIRLCSDLSPFTCPSILLVASDNPERKERKPHCANRGPQLSDVDIPESHVVILVQMPTSSR